MEIQGGHELNENRLEQAIGLNMRALPRISYPTVKDAKRTDAVTEEEAVSFSHIPPPTSTHRHPIPRHSTTTAAANLGSPTGTQWEGF